jgi:hypothetical protein
MSINLNQPATMNINGIAAESDANAAITYLEMAYPDSLRIFVAYGATTTTVFTPGASLPKVIISVNLNTGAWSATNGVTGTLLSAGLTTLQNIALNLRNGLESFAVNQAVVAGTAAAWTAASF